MPEGLDIKGFPLLCLINLTCVSKVKVVSFLLGLVLTFLIMASYLLMWDRKGLQLSALPHPLRPVVIMTSATTAEDSLDSIFIDLKTLVKMINSNEQNMSRKVPDEKDVMNTDPRVSLRDIYYVH